MQVEYRGLMIYKECTDEEFASAVHNNITVTGVLRELRIGNIQTTSYMAVYARVIELGLDTSHWKGSRSNNFKKKISLADILKVNSTYGNNNLKPRLIAEGLLQYMCAICGISKWQENELVLELDHINGANTDNRLENLRLLCPNCHSQTNTYCGKNTARSRVHKCEICQARVSRLAKRCKKCTGNGRLGQTKIDWPDVTIVLAKIKSSSISAYARELGVSGTAVEKYLCRHGVVKPKRSYKRRY